MTLMSWKASYALGHAAIDQDHRIVLQLINDLNDSTANGAAGAAVAQAIAAMDGYVRDHFAREEALMRDCGYPRLAEHTAEHRRLSSEFGRLKQDHLAGRGELLNTRMLMFLANWWIKHIQEWDAQLVALTRGAAPA